MAVILPMRCKLLTHSLNHWIKGQFSARNGQLQRLGVYTAIGGGYCRYLSHCDSNQTKNISLETQNKRKNTVEIPICVSVLGEYIYIYERLVGFTVLYRQII